MQKRPFQKTSLNQQHPVEDVVVAATRSPQH